MLMEQFKPLDQLMRYVQEQRAANRVSSTAAVGRKWKDTAARLQSRGISAAAYHAGLETLLTFRCVREKFQRDDHLHRRPVALWNGIN